MEVPVVELVARIMLWAVGGRRYHPFVSFSALRWAATTGRSASDLCSRVATSVRTLVKTRLSCGAGVGGLGRFTSIHRWNQTRARLSAQRDSGAARTRGYLTATSFRNAKTSLQSSEMVDNVSAAAVSAEAYFASPGFSLASTASIVMTLLSLLASSASLEESASDSHSVMERAKILRSLPWVGLRQSIVGTRRARACPREGIVVPQELEDI